MKSQTGAEMAVKHFEKVNLDTLGVTAVLILDGETFFPTLFRLLGVILTGHALPDPNQLFLCCWLA